MRILGLLKKIPNWIDEYTDDEGLDINKEGAIDKTYGLKYLIGGLNDAYSIENYTKITINIK